MSPMLKTVENAGRKAIAQKRKPYRIQPADFFHDIETLKSLFADLIHVPNPDSIVTIPSVSYGLSNVANNLHRDSGEILVVEDQFPSNVYPWKSLEDKGYKLKVVPRGKDSAEWNSRILEAINKDTVLLAIGHVHWVDGSLFDLVNLRKRLNEVDAMLIIDGTQSIGALPFDQSAIQADAIVCAGYKWLMGPYGIGLAYYGPRFQEGTPIEQNWINRKDSQDFGRLIDYTDDYRPGAARYGVGEQSNFILVSMMIQGIKQILKWTPEVIQAYCGDLMTDPLKEAAELGFVSESISGRAFHLMGLAIPSHVNLDQMKAILKDRKVSVSVRGNTIRVAPHVYNDEKDVSKLMSVLRALKA